jgi:hypothetical protein
VKREHILKYETHDEYYMPEKECASCHEAEVRAANEASKEGNKN